MGSLHTCFTKSSRFKIIGRPVLDKGTSVITFTATATITTTTATAAMFPNADDNLSNCVENPSQYN